MPEKETTGRENGGDSACVVSSDIVKTRLYICKRHKKTNKRLEKRETW
jgi:hypothetical protein